MTEPTEHERLETKRTLAEDLARYIDTEAFVAKNIGKEKQAYMKMRRASALKRAKAAVRFFMKRENQARLEAAIAQNSE